MSIEYHESSKLLRYSFGALILKALHTHSTKMNSKLLEINFKEYPFTSKEVHEANIVPQHPFDVLVMAAGRVASKGEYVKLNIALPAISKKIKHYVLQKSESKN